MPESIFNGTNKLRLKWWYIKQKIILFLTDSNAKQTINLTDSVLWNEMCNFFLLHGTLIWIDKMKL